MWDIVTESHVPPPYRAGWVQVTLLLVGIVVLYLFLFRDMYRGLRETFRGGWRNIRNDWNMKEVS